MISKSEIPKKINFSEGETILFDKPSGISSFDVIRKLKRIIFIKKIGHAGTLDPLATGLLILCTGRFTKKINQFQDLPKQYTATFRLGASTPSYDSETEQDQNFPWDHITEEAIQQSFEKFKGDIMQIPPLYSAIHVKGERLYKRALRGEKPELKARSIHIESLSLLDIKLPDVVIKVNCSKGTYIRSLVHDIGHELNSGAYMIALRRDAIGSFTADDAIDFDLFEKYINTSIIESE